MPTAKIPRIEKKHILPCLSFLSFFLLILVVMTIISPSAAGWFLGVIAIIFSVSFEWIKGLRGHAITRWTNMSKPIHYGLLSIFIIFISYYLSIFIRNYRIDFKIEPKNSK